MNKTKPSIALPAIALIIFLAFSMMGCKDKIEVTQEENPELHTTGKPNLNVFLENSGSMDGYMVAGSQLKDAIYSYVSDLMPECDTIGLYYINSQIIKRPTDLESYIKNLTPSNFASAGGNRSNSDLGNVIKNILVNTPQNTVSILISDCILDLPSNDAEKYLTTMSIQIKNEINTKLKENPDFGVIILRMESDFKGNYFYPNGTVESIEGKRPYYIWMFGNKNYLGALKREVPFDKIKHGYKNYVAFTNATPIPFAVSNTGMTGKVTTEKNGVYEMMLRADFTPTLQPEDVITAPQYFNAVSPAITIKEIKPILTPDEQYTHYILISLQSGALIAQENITFCPPHMPQWVATFNDESAENIALNMDKTTGIRSLVEGIADAYDKHKISTNFKFNIKRK